MSDPWWPDGYADPAFVVQRKRFATAMGGDYVRGSGVITLPQTALRYPTEVPGFDSVENKAYLAVRPWLRLPPVEYRGTVKDDYGSAQISWGWPVGLAEKWTEVALVRSGFGDPITVNDGETLFRSPKDGYTDEDGKLVLPPPVVIDQPLQSGQWYYYSLFFQTGNVAQPSWVLGMSGNVQIPRDYHHDEHLWNTLPPFYRWTDSNLREGNGFLRNILTVFGYELDTAREYVEQWQECYHVDKAPMALLKRVGENLGEEYRGGIGQIRYRGLIAALPEALNMRGTSQSMQQIIEAASKWLCEVTVGTNLMLLPDDSDFGTGTGNWATLHPDTDTADVTVTTLPPTDVILTANAIPAPAGYGRGTMQVKTLNATETQPLCITCGSGITVSRSITPLYSGVPVEGGSTYGFSAQIKMEVASKVLPVIFWFTGEGQPDDLIGRSSGNEAAPPNTNWNTFSATGAAPASAVYMVPGLIFNDRPTGGGPTYSPVIDIAGASVYLLGSSGAVTVLAPDSYLTMGGTELLGDKQAPGAPGDFTEYLMGSPHTESS